MKKISKLWKIASIAVEALILVLLVLYIKEYRERLGLNRKALARMLGVDRHLLDNWEKEKKRMSENSWEKYFRDILGE